VGVSSRAYEEVEVAVVISVEEEDSFVFEVGELVEDGFGFECE
jgi:hypothetical protein